MTEFKKYKLGDICDLNKNSLKVSDTFDTIEYLDTSSITENTIDSFQNFSREDAPSRAQRKVQNETIIFSTVRPNQNHFGLIQNPKTNLIVSSGFTTLDVKDKIEFDAKYLYYNLTQPSVVNFLQTLAQNSVSAYPSINPDDIGNLYLRFPEVSTQKKIASVLSNIDRKISVNREINRNLEELAKLIYDYWFVQFDFPNEEGKPYKSSGGKMVWNEILNRKIPDGWEVKLLKDIIEIKRGITITEKQTTSGTIKVVAAGLTYSYLHGESNRTPNCITVSGSGANAGFVNFWREPIFASDCSTIQFDNDIDTILCYHTLKKQEKRFYQISHKSAQPHILPSDIGEIPMIIPSNSIKERISQFFIKTNKQIAENTKELEHLSSLRDNLLPLLMNGQVTLNSCLSAD